MGGARGCPHTTQAQRLGVDERALRPLLYMCVCGLQKTRGIVSRKHKSTKSVLLKNIRRGARGSAALGCQGRTSRRLRRGARIQRSRRRREAGGRGRSKRRSRRRLGAGSKARGPRSLRTSAFRRWRSHRLPSWTLASNVCDHGVVIRRLGCRRHRPRVRWRMDQHRHPHPRLQWRTLRQQWKPHQPMSWHPPRYYSWTPWRRRMRRCVPS